ncbi:uncharacterized protein [Choristoneura fumiferana]|uniref:uncharacterized protein n=1 Tax=Choristoneura fumiferana TaxID=7141 RepID=UPI003D15CB3C
MVLTRSNSGKESKEESSSAGETTATTSTNLTTTTSSSGETGTTTGTGTTEVSASASGSVATSARDQVDTSGIKATPAASTDTVVIRQPSQQMPPPAVTKAPPQKPARSRHSKASGKRLLAGLEAKERLAELELKRVRAEAELEKIRLEKMAAESELSDTEEEEDDLASQRIADWIRRSPNQERTLREERRPPTHTHKERERRDHYEEQSHKSAMDLTMLTAALTEAIHAGKSSSTNKYIPDLPPFSGLSNEWLQFQAAYTESAASFTANENVARIRKALKGVALEAVSALLISQPRPDDVVSALQRRFGRPDALLIGEIEKMKALPRLTDNPRDLCIFASRVANTVATIEMLKRPQYLHTPEVLRTIVDKLTPILRSKWYDYATINEDVPEIKKIAEFLNREADKCAPYAPPELSTEKQENKIIKKKVERAYTATTETATKSRKEAKSPCPQCKQEGHHTTTCPNFIKADTNERWEIAKKHTICYRCLISKHRRYECRAKPCGRGGCPMRHHRLLHHEKPSPASPDAPKRPPQPPIEPATNATVEQVGAATTKTGRAYLKIAPVVLRGPQATIETYALLDDGSTVTIIDAAVADVLGLDGPTEQMWVQGVSGTEVAHKKSKRVGVAIRGKYSDDELQINNARTVASLDFATQSINERELRDCRHLEDIKNEVTCSRATPKILIGQDNWELIISQEIRRGRRDQLVASRTLLGWVLHGCRTSQAEPVAYCCAHLTLTEPANHMEKMMRDYFALESLSIEPRKQKSDPELQALEILEKTSRRLPDGRFETGLLWREREGKIPNNRADALKRLHTLERKLDRDEQLKKQYDERVLNLLTSKYAEPAAAPPSARTWYLPHFAVCNPDKPKIRLVHDAAAKSHGRSLNDMLLSGPDLLQSLPGVIMRFRQHAVAVSADIKEMFMQIKIREEDRDALRFLWRGDRREGEAQEYRMSSVIFGATSSPCTALYIKNRNAREHAEEYPDAARAIERNHYMDDYLQSFATIEEARRVIKDVDFIHKKAGFELRGWAYNECEREGAMSLTGGSEREGATSLIGGSERDGATVPIGGSEIEKTLGLLWDTKRDSISFRLNNRRAPVEIMKNLRPPTKREALSLIMSIFDPLGLISPITTPAKRIMQDTWRYDTAWDEELPPELHDRWSEWLQQLHRLGDLHVPRCYGATPGARYELHTFVDASQEAYAAAVYWRIIHADDSVTISLAAGKSRVTPNKPISVPRLELQAALLGARLANTVADEHDYEVARRTYWSDSRTALAWIRSEPRTFKTFVAHRLAEIEDLTKKNEWRWLPSADNVADDATRATPEEFGPRHRWFRGPLFLYEREDSWPEENKVEIPATGEEKEKCNALQDQRARHAHLPEIERFSKWTRLLRTTARVLQFIDLCRHKRSSPAPQVVAAARRKRTRANQSQDEEWDRRTPTAHVPRNRIAPEKHEKYIVLPARYINKAEQLLTSASQKDAYAQERQRITDARAPERDDRLAKISVFIDADGVMRLRGRIAAADAIQKEMVNPAVLHRTHYYTKLYIAHIHEKLHHGGTEIVVNELRQRVYIAKIRPAVKEVIARCARCLLRKARPAAPATGDLPAARLAYGARPFSFTGLDYFGPLEVTVARHREKRHVALFTCLTSRAVHLEVVVSLSTDSAINALRRFIARRGCPTELWSDNATAFRGAARELSEAVKNEAEARRINWRFLPAAAPFMAGAWERMVRGVKEALKATLHEKYPSDEILHTLLLEAEATVNSRPLTHVSVDPNDPTALTPNMILLGPDCHSPAPGTFEESDGDARQQWRRAQQLADTFWRRWVREYLPLLQHRREPHSSGASPAVGDVVIICDSNMPRNTWPRGRITRIYPGKDGVVRVVDVTTSRGHVLRRPARKIVVLPVGSHGDGGRNVQNGV